MIQLKYLEKLRFKIFLWRKLLIVDSWVKRNINLTIKYIESEDRLY